MKLRHIFVLAVLSLFLGSCDKGGDGSPRFSLSKSNFDNVGNEGGILELKVECNMSWVASSAVSWCTVSPDNGTGNATINITVDTNIDKSERTGSITFTCNGAKKIVAINQLAADSNREYHYKLPVIFHVLYKDRNNNLQYVNEGRLADMLSYVNKLYQQNNMNLEFTLATTNPKTGEILTEPGVERIQWDTESIDCDKFMSENSGKNVKLLWDPNNYINIMVYNFVSDNSGSTTLGISHFPYATEKFPLAGIEEIRYSNISLANLSYPHCVSINSLFVYEQSDNTSYTTSDVVVTLAHELGHYLGLLHTFAEDKKGFIDDCIDTDYCNDTPTYNRVKYVAYYMDIAINNPADLTFNNLVKRYDSSRDLNFIAHNIMDYAIYYSDLLSADQQARVRHVLTYSPLIPGPKIKSKSSVTAHEGLLDLPVRVIK